VSVNISQTTTESIKQKTIAKKTIQKYSSSRRITIQNRVKKQLLNNLQESEKARTENNLITRIVNRL